MEILVAGGLAGFGENSLKLFENELKQAVMPFVEKNYRTLKRMQITGHWPAYQWVVYKHLYAGIKNTDMFSYLGVFSSGWWCQSTRTFRSTV